MLSRASRTLGRRLSNPSVIVPLTSSTMMRLSSTSPLNANPLQPVRFDRAVAHLGDSLSRSQLMRDVREMHDRYASQFEKVKKILTETGMFSKTLIDSEAMDYYNNLGLNEYYFQTASPEMIAANLQCVIAAKVLNNASKSDLFPVIQQETADEVFWMARSSLLNRNQSQNYLVEQELENKYFGYGDDQQVPWRLQCYRSTGSIFDANFSDTERLRTYFLQRPDWKACSPDEVSLDKVVDSFFSTTKRGTATERIYQELVNQVVADPSGLRLFSQADAREDGFRLDFAFRRSTMTQHFFSTMGDTFAMFGLYSHRKYVEPLANGVTIVTAFVDALPSSNPNLPYPTLSLEERIQSALSTLELSHILPRNGFTDMARERILSMDEAAYAGAVARFVQQFAASVGPAFARIASVLEGSKEVSMQELYSVRTRLKQPPFGLDQIEFHFRKNTKIVKDLFAEFATMHNPELVAKTGKPTFQCTNDLSAAIDRLESNDAMTIFRFCRLLTRYTLKTNFFVPHRLALSFRMHPDVLPESDFPDRPFGFFFISGHSFVGFHTRFQDISRGGIRVVHSYSPQQYLQNRQKAFDECYNLARTQHFKNKDLPEGGAKGVVLLDCTPARREAAVLNSVAFKQYIDSLLDLLLLSEDQVVDHHGKPEVIFCGPDENTGVGGLMDWACEHARARGAWFWKAFTTGKQPVRGGIPHDFYGMTTSSVEEYVRAALKVKGIKEEDGTKVLIGGPDGDLGSNSLLMSKMKTIAVVDGAGVVCDPLGLDRNELHRLARMRFHGEVTTSQMYNVPLSAQGFKVNIADVDVTLPCGYKVPSGRLFRDNFHTLGLVTADVFNPCGGRPESLSAVNVDSFFNPKTGEPYFPIVIEGGNLFCTNDARKVLEQRGVMLYKDASTNKGGVTSSSLEVLAALALNDEQFTQNMCVQDKLNPPAFYAAYVEEVLMRIRANAQFEFKILYEQGNATGKPRCELTETLSRKVIELDSQIQSSDLLWNDLELRKAALDYAVPRTLSNMVSLEDLETRVPMPYLRSLFASVLASRFFYKYGFNASTCDFLGFAAEVKAGSLKKDFDALNIQKEHFQRW